MNDERAPADVEIGARAKARSLRLVRKAKDGRVRFHGDPAPDTARFEERQGMPEELEEGATYRNVEIRWAVGARLRERGRGRNVDG
ncbi:MAG TPA: hypothetical protein VIL04_13975 [Solirubrobacterales bacterium]|jgi:hypothetical protein